VAPDGDGEVEGYADGVIDTVGDDVVEVELPGDLVGPPEPEGDVDGVLIVLVDVVDKPAVAVDLSRGSIKFPECLPVDDDDDSYWPTRRSSVLLLGSLVKVALSVVPGRMSPARQINDVTVTPSLVVGSSSMVPCVAKAALTNSDRLCRPPSGSSTFSLIVTVEGLSP
jgi:hypothetical protein